MEAEFWAKVWIDSLFWLLYNAEFMQLMSSPAHPPDELCHGLFYVLVCFIFAKTVVYRDCFVVELIIIELPSGVSKLPFCLRA